jgi:hypothetical protein
MRPARSTAISNGASSGPRRWLHDLKALGDEKAVKSAGRCGWRPKEYVVKDGDIINFDSMYRHYSGLGRESSTE